MFGRSIGSGRGQRGTFGRTPFYLLTLSILTAVAAAGFLLLPDTRTASAKADDPKSDTRDGDANGNVATQAMLDYALNLKTASEYTVYAERGVSQKGSSITGEIGDARRDAAGRKATKELSSSINAIRQLPCTDLTTSDLSGKTFAPGVYCLKSAELAGEMTLDGGGNSAGTFVFRVEGSLKAKGGSNIRLENAAQAGNVFFVSETASIANNVNFRSNILTTKSANVSGTVTGKVLSLGEVSMDMAHVAGGGTGTMEICKEEFIDFTRNTNDGEERPDGVPLLSLSNQIFQFTVTGAINQGTAANPVQVAVGQCSAPFDVAIGPQTVTELNNGTLISPAGTPWAGNFELVDVRNLTPGSTSTLGLVNLALRTAQVNIVQGDTATQLTLEFTNRPTITGFIEICKQAARGPDGYNPAAPPSPFGGGDPDVTGYFDFTIQGVYTTNTLNPTQRVSQIFSIPVGQCTGPIAVTRGTGILNNVPRAAIVAVTELAPTGSYLESVAVTPSSRLFSTSLGLGVNAYNQAFPNLGGGLVYVEMPESATSANETLITFINRSNPGMVKVCKIAGPGIPLNTLFSFTVTSNYGATLAVPPQPNVYGPVTVTIDIRAGDPAQGGQCKIVPGLGAGNGYAEFQTYLNGTPVTVTDNGISPNNTIPQNPGTLMTSRIRTSSTFTTSVSSSVSSDFEPPTYAPGNINGQDGWMKTGPYDHAVVLNNSYPAPPSFGTQSFRISNAVTSGSFGDMTFSKSNPNEAGETSAQNGGMSGGTRQSQFSAAFDIASFVPGAQQAGLNFSTSPDRGDGARMSYLRFEDQADGVHVFFDDYKDNAPFGGAVGDAVGCGVEDDFAETDIATLNRAVPHNIRFEMMFVDGPRNDIVKIYIDGLLAHTGTSWEDYFRYCEGNPTRTVDSLLFRTSGPANPSSLGKGFVLDNVALGSGSDTAVIARAGVVEVEFVNYRFNPAQLKVCKIGGAGVPNDGTSNYTFDVTFVSPVSQPGNVPLFPGNLTTQVTVTANDPPGNCSFAYGPFAGGTYNQGSMVTVTEQTGNPTSITSTSAGPGGFSADLANKRGTFTGPNGIVAGINAVTFTNIGATPYVGAARYDYDGDHKADPSIFTPSSSKWTWAASAEGGLNRTNTFGIATDKVVPADYDGDGKTDIAVYRPETGMWYFLGSTQVFQAHQWGQPGDIPQTGDFDGDGKADFVVFRPSNGTWYEKRSRDGFNFVEFGRSGDRPLAADYDGDGKTDLGVLRPENHTWYTLGSTLGFRAAQFGQTGDIPVPADYDGDGAADIAVYRGGMWYILTRTAFLSYQYGIATDTPVPDDYDGDGRTDLAVYRASEGKWYVAKSNTAEPATPDSFTLGTTGDTIIPGAY